MKRLIAKKDDPNDQFLGAPIEIIYPKSKYIGFQGWIDEHYHKDQYKLMFEPQAWENTDKWHTIYVNINDIYKWVRILQQEV